MSVNIKSLWQTGQLILLICIMQIIIQRMEKTRILHVHIYQGFIIKHLRGKGNRVGSHTTVVLVTISKNSNRYSLSRVCTTSLYISNGTCSFSLEVWIIDTNYFKSLVESSSLSLILSSSSSASTSVLLSISDKDVLFLHCIP